MPIQKFVAPLLTAIACCGCLQSTVLVKVNADGSGTIENQTLMATAALSQLRQLSGAFGRGDAQSVDPFSEQQIRDLAGQMGEGVTVVSTRPLKTALAEGREAVYAFRDITKLRVNQTPAAAGSGAAGLGLGGAPPQDPLTIDLTRTPAGSVLLTFHTGVDPLSAMAGQLGSTNGRGPIPADQLALARQMLAGMRIALRVAPAGRVVRTSSPYVDGQTVTLFDVNVDALLSNDAAFARLQSAKSAAEAAEALKNVPGVKINLDRDITIEFAP